MQTFKKIFLKEGNFILLLILVITAFGLFSLFYNQFKIAPKNSLYTFVHNYVPDYYQYLSWMKDGADGKILITSRHSPDNFPRKPVYLFYSFAGWLSERLGLTMFLGYTLIRISFSLLKLFIIAFLISQTLKQAQIRKLAFFFVLFLPPFYYLSPFRMLRRDISSLDILQRSFFLPHNLATFVFLITGAILFNVYLKGSKLKTKERTFSWANYQISLTSLRILYLSSFFFFLCSITNPAMLTIFYLFLGIALFISFWQKPDWSLIIKSLAIFLPGLPLIVYYQGIFSRFLPFSWFYQQQKQVVLMTNLKDYLLNCGPVIFFVPFGILPLYKNRNFLANFVLSWAIIPFLIFPFLGKLIPFSQERFFEISHYVPLGILGAVGLYSLTEFVKKVSLRSFIRRLIISLLVIFTLPYLFYSTRFQIDLFSKPYIFNVFVPNSLIESFRWLDQNTADESVVASGFFTSNMLPAFSHNKVVFGHEFVTYKSEERKAENEAIFNPLTPAAEIEKILEKNKINFLLFSLETPKWENTGFKNLNNLKKVFDNNENQIYQVIKNP